MTENKSKIEKKLEANLEKVEEKEMKEKKSEEKLEEKKKTQEKVKERPKKNEASVNVSGLPISTKHSMAVCDFIRGKKIDMAISELEKVAKAKLAVPMKGEIPHRKGEGMMSGRFPKKTAENFIVLLKSLKANATYSGIEEPVVVEAVPNIGSRPYGRFGAYRKKRTNVKLVAKSGERKNKGEKK